MTTRYLYGPGIDQVLAEERWGVTLVGPSGDSSNPEGFLSTGSGIPWTITPHTGGSIVLDDVYGDPVDVTLNSANLILDGEIDRAIWTQGGLEFVPMGSSGQFILGAESIEDLTGADLDASFGMALTVSGAGNMSQVLEIREAYFYDIPAAALVTDITFTLDVDNTGWGTFEVSNVSVSVTYYESTYCPETYWTLADHQGTVRDVVQYDTATDATVVRNHITYDAFGQITSESDSDYAVRFGYTGRDRDPETDLGYHRRRYYDAWMGQFLSEDPIGFVAGDVNYRRYVGNDPLKKIDPSGLQRRNPNDRVKVFPNYSKAFRSRLPDTTYLDGAIIVAKSKNIPTLLLDAAKKNGISVKVKNIPAPVYSPFFDQITLPKNDVTTVRLKRSGKTGQPVQGTLVDGIYNEAFHAYYDRVISRADNAEWLRGLMKRDQPWSGTWSCMHYSEEAMSELVATIVSEYWSGRRKLPTYDEIIGRRTQGLAHVSKIHLTPQHTGRDECFEGDPLAKLPMSESLYYATVWVIHKGATQPSVATQK